MRTTYRGILASGLLLFAAGCSGGGGVSVTPTGPSKSGTGARGTLTFSIAVPGRAPSSRAHRRLPAYVSASTTQVSVVVEGASESAPEAPQTFPCTAVCTGSISAPAGADRITLTLEDASAKALSTGVATAVVFAAQANTLSFTLDGVVTSVDLTFSNPTVPVVPAQSGYLSFNARDVDNNIITYDGHYADANDTALVFDLASSSAALTLGITTVSAPGTLIPYTYNGTAHVGTITVTPSAHAGVTTTATFTPSSVTLVPGIAAQIDAPAPITVVGVQQFTFPSTAFDPGAQLIVGNGADGVKVFAYNPTTGVYGVPRFQPLPGVAGVPFIASPTSTTPGVLGYTAQGNSLFASYEEVSSGTVSHGSAAASPCEAAADTPLGPLPPGTVICVDSAVGSADFVYTGAFSQVASGTVRKITSVGATVYVQTVDVTGVEVWTAAAKVANVTNFGYDKANANFYYAETDGTVHLAGSATALATFSKPVTMVVGNSPALYVMEGQSFGYFSGSSVSETGPLPIGTPFELIVGAGGVPIIVEADGRLDVMAI